ncbi:sigma-54-dependent Fis family transcriptional regulator [bacterium]|nr:sigma-54-dependent Fis family transcriptional regulator [bacterium]
MSQFSILIVDDEAAQRDTLSGYLKKKHFTVFSAESGKAAIDVVEKNIVDIILSDMRMPEMSGTALLKVVKQLNPRIMVVMMTAFGDVDDAVTAMKEGAEDYIQKPIDLDHLDIVIGKMLEKKQVLAENEILKETLRSRFEFKHVVSNSAAMENVLNLAGRAAHSRASVLLRGESGTGKEVIARAIHVASPRQNGPFVAVNMAAVPDNLVESEFFGHEKGAFTGADRQRQGRFEMADEGTLFIDEIGDMPVFSQIKLLRVLQERSFERVGGSQTVEIDVRIIAATSQNLETMIQEGQFREDLFYRLNVVSISIPPLRERREDIPFLIDHFIKRYSEEEAKSVSTVSREVMDSLMKHDYPGNVRELENIIQRGVVMARGEAVSTVDLPPGIGRLQAERVEPVEDGSLTASVEALERQMILHALAEAKGNQSAAARLLSITERNLRYKMKKYGMK